MSDDQYMSGDDLNRPVIQWREKLPREELDDLAQDIIQNQLELRLYGFRKPEESIVGYRVLYEDGGYGDLLLMRRDFAQSGYFFDLDVTLGRVNAEESDRLHGDVLRTIDMLMSDQMPM